MDESDAVWKSIIENIQAATDRIRAVTVELELAQAAARQNLADLRHELERPDRDA